MKLNSDGKPHDEYEKVSNAECSKAVLKTTLKSGNDQIKVMYAAEMDAIDTKGRFVEIETSRSGYTKWLKLSSLHSYLQSFFGKVEYLVKGQIDDERIVKRVDKIWTNKIPGKNINWDINVCMNKLFEVLQNIKDQLKNDDDAIVIRVRGKNIHYEPADESEWDFVDQHFLDYFY